MYDSQRLQTIKDVSTVLQQAGYTNDSTFAEIVKAWREAEPILKEAEQLDTSHSVDPEEVDPLVDASVRSLSDAISSILNRAIAKEDEKLQDVAKEVQGHLFKNGVSPIIYVGYKAQNAQLGMLLTRCEEKDVKTFLNAQGLQDHIALIAKHRKTMSGLIHEDVSPEESARRREALTLARKTFDKNLSRLNRYIGAKYNLEDEAQKKLHDAISEPITEARAAAEVERRKRSTKRQKSESPDIPSEQDTPTETKPTE